MLAENTVLKSLECASIVHGHILRVVSALTTRHVHSLTGCLVGAEGVERLRSALTVNVGLRTMKCARCWPRGLDARLWLTTHLPPRTSA